MNGMVNPSARWILPFLAVLTISALGAIAYLELVFALFEATAAGDQ